MQNYNSGISWNGNEYFFFFLCRNRFLFNFEKLYDVKCLGFQLQRIAPWIAVAVALVINSGCIYRISIILEPLNILLIKLFKWKWAPSLYDQFIFFCFIDAYESWGRVIQFPVFIIKIRISILRYVQYTSIYNFNKRILIRVR